MGMYTTLRINARINSNSPEYVFQTIRSLIDSDTESTEFFDCVRCRRIFRNYTGIENAKAEFNDCVLDVISSFKNYNDEIDNFVSFISPFLDGSYPNIIYSIYEEDSHPKKHIGSILDVNGDFAANFY